MAKKNAQIIYLNFHRSPATRDDIATAMISNRILQRLFLSAGQFIFQKKR